MDTRKSRGFALPTVLIASIIMLTVLVAAVTSTAAVRVALRTQYYNQLSQEASEAGVVYAKACIKANGSPGWTDARPLKPGTDCDGNALAGLNCTTTPLDSRCSVMIVDSNVLIGFSVTRPLQDSKGAYNNIQSTGSVSLLRSSDNTLWRQYTKSTKSTVVDKSFLNDLHWKDLSAGYYHTCGIASDDKAYCWGYNSEGQLGNNTTVSVNSPVMVDTTGVLAGLKLVSIKAAYEHTCALASDSNVYCWGAQTYGRLGNGITTGRSSVPVKVTDTGYLNGLDIKSLSTSTSSYSTCVIASDNNAYCWGANWDGQIGDGTTSHRNVPTPVLKSGNLNNQQLESISVGGGSTCVVAVDNYAYCWGWGGEGQMGDGTNTNVNSSPLPLSRTGNLSGLTIKSISVGDYSACVIASDDNGYCWGDNPQGGLGNGSNTDSNVPVTVTRTGVLSGLTLKTIEVGGAHTCSIASDNNAYCWGYGTDGQLGNNDNSRSYNVPVAVDRTNAFKGLTVNSIKSGKFHTCAIASDERAYCWGYDDYGQTSVDEYLISETPTLIRIIRNNQLLLNGLTISSITSGDHHVCAIASDTKTYCWGYNQHSQLGNGYTSISSPIPVAVYNGGALGGLPFKAISAGTYNTCGIATNNKAYCWGINEYGQLGDNTSIDRSTPVAVVDKGVLNNKDVNAITVGNYHTCAIASDNNAYCWGRNNYGQLGDNTNIDRGVPTAVDKSGALLNKTIISISAGQRHVCAIASDNNAYCWGRNNYGQLGDNTNIDRGVPTAVDKSGALLNKTIISISAGQRHVCAIASDNNAYCWGRNNYGQLGDNSAVNKKTPKAVVNTGVLGGMPIKAISSGYSHTCAIASDNNAYCWGLNDHGQLGDGSVTQSLVPVAVNRTGVLNGLSIKSILAKGDHTCAIASDNNAYCWGDNEIGGLGDGTDVDYSNVPVAVVKNGALNNQDVKSIAGGLYHTCAIAADDKIYCWGTNHYGEHGNSIYRDTNVPAAVLNSITSPPNQSRTDFGSVYY